MVPDMTPRLTRTHWLDHGLLTLAVSGANALKVAPMSAALKVSRGSFYWHFKDIADFHDALLAHWRDRTTDQTILAVEAQDGEGIRLNALMKRAFDANPRLDRAVRYWAADSVEVARLVAAVDVERVAYIARMLVSAGVPDARAGSRAAFLYWAYLGQTVLMDSRLAALPIPDIDEISALFKT